MSEPSPIKEAYEAYYQANPQADRAKGQLNIRRTINRLSNIKGLKQHSGLCQVAYDTHTHKSVPLIIYLLQVAFGTWPEHSGDDTFPVAPTKDGCYFNGQKLGIMYSKTTEYGKARRRLAEHVIKELQSLQGKPEADDQCADASKIITTKENHDN